MRISRLDKIVSNNVGYSTQKKNDEQIIYLLQDINETLAMIYDKMCESDTEEDSIEQEEDNGTYVIPQVDIPKRKKMIFEDKETKIFYPVTRKSIKGNELIVEAFGGYMDLDMRTYGKKWRCWSGSPTYEEMMDEPWEK